MGSSASVAPVFEEVGGCNLQGEATVQAVQRNHQDGVGDGHPDGLAVSVLDAEAVTEAFTDVLGGSMAPVCAEVGGRKFQVPPHLAVHALALRNA